jgi:hypothetical protein
MGSAAGRHLRGRDRRQQTDPRPRAVCCRAGLTPKHKESDVKVRRGTIHPGVPWWDHQFHYLAVHGLNIAIGLGAGAGAVGVAAAGLVAVLYGRRASVAVSAEAHQTPKGIVIAARPVVRAVGIVRVKFHESKGMEIRLREVYVQAGELKEGRYWTKCDAFGPQFVEAGEELTTAVVFPPLHPPPSVIGWMVFLNASAPTRLKRIKSGWWSDQVFVPRPLVEATVVSGKANNDDARARTAASSDSRPDSTTFWAHWKRRVDRGVRSVRGRTGSQLRSESGERR